MVKNESCFEIQQTGDSWRCGNECFALVSAVTLLELQFNIHLSKKHLIYASWMFTSGHVVCSVPQGLSLWFRANFQTQVLIRRRDTVWQIWGINWGLTTSHYVRRYWSKFRLVPLIKGKNNTAYEADDSKERLDGGLNDFGWVTVVHEGCCSLQKHGADGQPYQGLGEWRTWSEPTSLRWMWRVVGGPSDLLLTAVRRWPLPCHVATKSTHERFSSLIRAGGERARTKSYPNITI